MLMDLNGDPSLGQLYRHLDSRLERARFFGNHNFAIGSILHELKVRLDAWADVIDYKRDVLEAVERDGGELAARTRKSFLHLHDALGEFEVWLPQLSKSPSDRSAVARGLQAISHFRQLFQSLLMDQTGQFSHYYMTAARNSTRPLPSRSNTLQQKYSSHKSVDQPSTRHMSNSSLPTALHHYTQFPPTPTSLPISRTPSVFVKHESYSDPHRPESRPSTAGSLPGAPMSDFACSSVTSFPSVSEILSGSNLRTFKAPYTSSADSSPLTPSIGPCMHHANPLSNGVDWDRPTLSPMKSHTTTHIARLTPMEPRLYTTSPLGIGAQSGPQSQWLGSYPQPRNAVYRYSGHF